MKVWIVMYSDSSGISKVFESKGLAQLYNRWAEDNIGIITSAEVETVAKTLEMINQ